MRFEEESFGICMPPSLPNVSCIMPPPSPSSGDTFMGLELQFYLELHQMLVSTLFNTSVSPSPSPSFQSQKACLQYTSLSLFISPSASG